MFYYSDIDLPIMSKWLTHVISNEVKSTQTYINVPNVGNKVILCYTCKLISAILRSKKSEIRAVFKRINRIEHWKIPQHIIN